MSIIYLIKNPKLIDLILDLYYNSKYLQGVSRMNKPTAIKRFIFIGIFLVLGFVLAFASFDIPFTHYTYNGFANSIKLGLDLKGGVMAVYEATEKEGEEGDFEQKLLATKTRITQMITEEYSEAVITIQQGNRIRVEVPDVSDPETVFDLIGQPASLEFKAEEDTDGHIHEAVLTGENIVNAYASQQQTSSGTYEYGVSIEFDAEGAQAFYELTKQQTGSQIYIYRNGELFSAPTVNEAISGGKTFISGSMDTMQEAEEFATQILSGTFSLDLTLLENTVVSATLGVDAIKYGLIAGAIAILLIFAFMIWRYKMMGVMASIALCFYVILTLFFLQALLFVQLTLAGIAGIILSIGMAIDGNIIIFERIKEEYAAGKRINQSIRSGFKRSLAAILDSNITTIVVSFILILLGTGSIRGFAITLLIGTALSMFTSLVVTRGLLMTYYPLNSNNAKSYNLKRGEDVIELA